MVRPVVSDVEILKKPSVEASIMDVSVADDLMDTLNANSGKCVGMAANMIGENVRIIAVIDEGRMMEMFNPRITAQSGVFDALEGCLSLAGFRRTKRYRSITVEWQTRGFQTKRAAFSGWTAQIIQHEIDHLNGILI